MLTKDDKSWLVTSFVTRGEHHADITELRESGSRIEKKVDKLLTKFDGFAGKLADLDQENKMGAITTRRHGIHIQELAKATGTALSK